MTYGHLQADCVYTGISSGPNTWYGVWATFTFTFLLTYFKNLSKGSVPEEVEEVDRRGNRLIQDQLENSH